MLEYDIVLDYFNTGIYQKDACLSDENVQEVSRNRSETSREYSLIIFR